MTWIAVTKIGTIDSLREDASAGSLTRSTRTMKEVCMPHTVVCECTTEDCLDAVLADDRVPVARSILGVEAHEKWQIMSCQYYMKKPTKDNQKIQPNWVELV